MLIEYLNFNPNQPELIMLEPEKITIEHQFESFLNLIKDELRDTDPERYKDYLIRLSDLILK